MRVKRFVDTEAAPTAPHNLCGVLVHARPERLDPIQVELKGLPGVEIHHATSDGKLVVTVEDTPASRAGAVIESFNTVAGVLSVALVYHHFDSDLQGETAP